MGPSEAQKPLEKFSGFGRRFLAAFGTRFEFGAILLLRARAFTG
jgi:hypothetical protein